MTVRYLCRRRTHVSSPCPPAVEPPTAAGIVRAPHRMVRPTALGPAREVEVSNNRDEAEPPSEYVAQITTGELCVGVVAGGGIDEREGVYK
jgi:hypothetical protein